jgi:hypothetical protein
MKKELQVVMLPTEDKSNINLHLGKLSNKITMLTSIKNRAESIVSKAQHLYFTSDEEIKAGDNVYNTIGKTIGRIYTKKEISQFNRDTHKKIIATTDTKLWKHAMHESGRVKVDLPKIPQSFIEEYCKQGGIDGVELEYDYKLVGDFKLEDHKSNNVLIPKLTPNNEVIIHLIEEKLYSKEEIVELLANFQDSLDYEYPEIKFNNWIKENL